MEKNLVEPFKNQYVKIVKDTGEILDGIVIEILEDSIIFQTELTRSAFSIKSIKEIIPFDEISKKRSMRRSLKSNKY